MADSVPMELRYERRLVFTVLQAWSGWFCERCCWNRPLPCSPEEVDKVSAQVRQQFEAHDCEAFARENWPSREQREA